MFEFFSRAPCDFRDFREPFCMPRLEDFDIFCRWTLAKLLLFNLLTACRDVAVVVGVVEVVADGGALPVID